MQMQATIDAVELTYVGMLYGGFLLLWRVKRVRQRRQTGIDPDVLGTSMQPLQRYFAQMTRVLKAVLVVLFVGHALGMPWPGFLRLPALNVMWANHLGLAVGLFGLLLCFAAQRRMGSAWRVGIDETHQTALVQSGLYAYVRNPTYLGLFLVNAGLWFVWPTAGIAVFALVFFVLMEVQVRCEEEHLEAAHGDAFRTYRARTFRYLPYVY